MNLHDEKCLFVCHLEQILSTIRKKLILIQLLLGRNSKGPCKMPSSMR